MQKSEVFIRPWMQASLSVWYVICLCFAAWNSQHHILTILWKAIDSLMNTSTSKCKATSHEFYVAVLPFFLLQWWLPANERNDRRTCRTWWRQIYPQTRSGEWIRTKIGIHRRTKTFNDDRNMFRCLAPFDSNYQPMLDPWLRKLTRYNKLLNSTLLAWFT